jgi:hypothetical protein
MTLDLKFEIRVAALDTTSDGVVNYDTLVIFEKTRGVESGHFQLGRGSIKHKTIAQVRNIDVAPTIMHLLGVAPGEDVDGRVLAEILR